MPLLPLSSYLLCVVAVKSKAPYSTLLTHGFLLDEKGYKMSKSLGNTIVPSSVTLGGKVSLVQCDIGSFCRIVTDCIAP